jgi:pilus assembly protein CpaC
MHTTKTQRYRPAIGELIILAGLALFSLNAFAGQQGTMVAATQVPATAAAPPAQPPQAGVEQGTQEAQGPQMLHLLVGRSLVITSPNRIKRVSLADPNIADAIVVTPYQVVVNGKTPGGVSLIIWDEAGQNQSFEVSVDIDVLGLTQKIHEVFPAEPVQVETSKDVVMLSGRISSAAVADKILEVVKNSTPKVTSLMEVPPPPVAQILLQVKFADLNRTAISQYGINILRNFGSNMPMSVTTGQFSPPSIGQTQTVTSNGTTSTTTNGTNQFLLSNLLNIAIFRPDINLDAFIQALQENNLLEILAEPNLLTESGKEASFLAGGQFPFPVLQNITGGTAGAITIQFKDFGVRLNFTPTLRPDGLMHLKVEPEVSTLDFTNAVTLQGFLIPALAVNRANSEMDLRDGQSFAIAGLLDNRVTEQFQKIPFIGDIPILGKLFQSRTVNKSKSELLIIVTPHIVQPIPAGETLPALQFPKAFLPSLGGVGQAPQAPAAPTPAPQK